MKNWARGALNANGWAPVALSRSNAMVRFSNAGFGDRGAGWDAGPFAGGAGLGGCAEPTAGRAIMKTARTSADAKPITGLIVLAPRYPSPGALNHTPFVLTN